MSCSSRGVFAGDAKVDCDDNAVYEKLCCMVSIFVGVPHRRKKSARSLGSRVNLSSSLR